MLNVRSTQAEIVGAALRCFARDGFATPLRTIAEEAGVSAALIVHHFGSKAGLRDAVDDHVLGIAEEKMRAYDTGGPAAALALVVALMEDGAIPRYIGRVLADGGAAGTRLFTSFVDVTEKALLDIDVPEPRIAAALLVVHSLGLMTMTGHVEHATGLNPYRGDGVHHFIAAALSVYGGALRPFLPT